MNRTLNLSPVNYWTEQPFLNRCLGARYDPPAQGQSSIKGSLYVPMDSIGAAFEVIWNGGGTITLGAGTANVQQRAGWASFTWHGQPQGFLSLIMRSAGQSGFRVVRSDQRSRLDAGEIWRPDFLADVAGFTAFRCMDWMGTNGSVRTDVLLTGGVVDTAQGKQVSLDLIVDLANRTGIRPWINLPHRITDAATTAAFQRLDATCGPRPIVEYSNEVWNWMFEQTRWAAASAPAPHLGDNNYFYGRRVGQIARLARGHKIDMVIAGQLVDITKTNRALQGFADAGALNSDVAAFAAATYVGGHLNDYTHYPDLALGLMDKNDIAGAHASLIAFLPTQRGWYNQWAALAHGRGRKLWAYEGGMYHLNAQGAKRDVDKLRQFYQAVQLDARAPATLAAYASAWGSAGGEMEALYNLASASTVNGFFGAKLQPLTWSWLKNDLSAKTAPAPGRVEETADAGSWFAGW